MAASKYFWAYDKNYSETVRQFVQRKIPSEVVIKISQLFPSFIRISTDVSSRDYAN